MSFLLILIVVACTVNSQPQCLPSQTELFYENAENLTDWIFDTDGTAMTYYAPYTDYCYDEACYGISQWDYDSVTTTPNFLSKLGLISTIGFTDITINYALKHFAFNYTGGSQYILDSTADGECGSSYTVDGGTFSTLDSHVSVAGIPFDEWVNSPMLIITESLGADASNTAALQIRWEATSLWPINSTDSKNLQECYIDEIRLCGTAITTSTTATPTTSTPTTYHSDSVSDDSGSGSGDSSDSASKKKFKLRRKTKSRKTSSESSESIYSALSSMNGVDEPNVNEQNVNFEISVSPKTFFNIIFVLFLFVCFFTFLCIYQYKAPPAAITNIV